MNQSTVRLWLLADGVEDARAGASRKGRASSEAPKRDAQLRRKPVIFSGLQLVVDFGPRYLCEHGVQVCGLDLSSELVERARQLNPDIKFEQGNMFALNAADATWAGIVAFYSIIHIPRTDHVPVFSEMRRVLRSGGLLLLAFHVGDEVVHFDELWGQAVSLDFHLFCADAVVLALRRAGFEVEKIVERDPYPNVEAQTRRGYILASKRSEKGFSGG